MNADQSAVKAAIYSSDAVLKRRMPDPKIRTGYMQSTSFRFLFVLLEMQLQYIFKRPILKYTNCQYWGILFLLQIQDLGMHKDGVIYIFLYL